MLVQTSRSSHYARGVLHDEESVKRIAKQHLVRFWAVPIVEGRATVQGHPIDADEEPDPFDAMDNIDQYEPETQGGRLAAQQGEFLHHEKEFESPCVKCPNIWCSRVLEGVCRGEGEYEGKDVS